MVETCESSCRCPQTTHACRLVVLTGGPGAGKTAVLEIARKSFCKHIAIFPEAASILFKGGFWRTPSLIGKKGAQRAIFHVQRELESIVLGEAKHAIALCDRGTLDGLAYWPGEQSTFFQELGVSREAELQRYQAVIHLRTPEANQGYNFQNPVRTESAIEAREIDAHIENAWSGHPSRFFIDSETDFVTKAKEALRVVLAQLPPCCQAHELKLSEETCHEEH